jgi:hypothetical protein
MGYWNIIRIADFSIIAINRQNLRDFDDMGSSESPLSNVVKSLTILMMGKTLRLRTEFSSQACNDIFYFFQKKVSESVGFALLVFNRTEI